MINFEQISSTFYGNAPLFINPKPNWAFVCFKKFLSIKCYFYCLIFEIIRTLQQIFRNSLEMSRKFRFLHLFPFLFSILFDLISLYHIFYWFFSSLCSLNIYSLYIFFGIYPLFTNNRQFPGLLPRPFYTLVLKSFCDFLFISIFSILNRPFQQFIQL